MKIITIYWGYLVGEEHLAEEQFARIDFGNPQLDNEFITFDPLASSFFQGKFYSLREKKYPFPHRKLPSMRTETLVMYDEISIKIIDPPIDLETPVGIFQCIFSGEETQIKKAIEFLSEKINLRFSPCEFNLEKLYQKTRLIVTPKSLTISDLRIDNKLSGNLEVFPDSKYKFSEYLKLYKPKIQQLKIIVQEVNMQITLSLHSNGVIKSDTDILKLNLKETIFDAAIRSVFTGSKLT